MKKKAIAILMMMTLGIICLTGCEKKEEPADLKPVIYLYPETTTEVTVELDYNGELTTTYPTYENGWTVIAEPDGTLVDADGQSYKYLYWEGVSSVEYDITEGFCIPGSDTAEFLETALDQLGLTREEANEFIVFWLPRMEANAYNVISFRGKDYEENAKLNISPEPDSVLRVFMTWYGSERPVELPEQTLETTERTGFTVVEWGGREE